MRLTLVAAVALTVLAAPARAQCTLHPPEALGEVEHHHVDVEVGRGRGGWLVAWSDEEVRRLNVRAVGPDGRPSQPAVEHEMRGSRQLDWVQPLGDGYVVGTIADCELDRWGAACGHYLAIDAQGRARGASFERRRRLGVLRARGYPRGDSLFVVAGRWRHDTTLFELRLDRGQLDPREHLVVPFVTWWNGVHGVTARGEEIVALTQQGERWFLQTATTATPIDAPFHYPTATPGFRREGDHFEIYFRQVRGPLQRVDVGDDGRASAPIRVRPSDPLPVSGMRFAHTEPDENALSVRAVERHDVAGRRVGPLLRVPRSHALALAGDATNGLLVGSVQLAPSRVRVIARRVECR